MAMDSPLADPKESLTIFLRGADEVRFFGWRIAR